MLERDREGGVGSVGLLVLRLLLASSGPRHLAGLASRSMAPAMVASAYIRQLRFGLPLCCMHGLIAQEGMGLIARTAEGLGPSCEAVSQSHIRPARRAQRERRNRVCSVS
jgi:hypothetical protein